MDPAFKVSDDGLPKPLSWLAQLRTHTTTADRSLDVSNDLSSVKCGPVLAASPAVLHIASFAVAERRLFHADPSGTAAEFSSPGEGDFAFKLTTGDNSDDDVVALT
jgi:hypothetical protein